MSDAVREQAQRLALPRQSQRTLRIPPPGHVDHLDEEEVGIGQAGCEDLGPEGRAVPAPGQHLDSLRTLSRQRGGESGASVLVGIGSEKQMGIASDEIPGIVAGQPGKSGIGRDDRRLWIWSISSVGTALASRAERRSIGGLGASSRSPSRSCNAMLYPGLSERNGLQR